jgi:glycosyltransferase involved in cell wall biosynthesis
MSGPQKTEKTIIYMPALNEEKNIQRVISNLPKEIGESKDIEILVIDDGSADNTPKIAQEMGAVVISHHKNLGLGVAFQRAVKYALENEADILVSIDADGQFDPVDIHELVAPIQSGKAHMVTGNRFSKGKPERMPWIKYWGNRVVSKLLSFISKDNFQDVSCGFRAYSREALYQLNLFGAFSYTHEVILNLAFKGLSIVEHPIHVRYFAERKSRLASNLLKYAYNTITIIFRTMLDYKPLLFFGYLGLLNFLLAFAFIGTLFGHYIIFGAFTPYKSLGFIGLGFGIFSLLIFFIGLVADMFNRIRMNQEKILYELRKNNKG